MNLSASDVALATCDPFGLWQNHHGDQNLKNPPDEYALFLQEQGLRIEKELLLQRHPNFVSLKEQDFRAATQQTAQLLRNESSIIYGGAIQSDRLGLHARPDVLVIQHGHNIVEEYKLAGTPTEAHKIQALCYAYILKNEYGIQSGCKLVSRRNEEFLVAYEESRIEAAIRLAHKIVGQDKPPPPTYNCRSDWKSLQNRLAKEQHDITLAWNVGPVLAEKLRDIGIRNLKDLMTVDPS